MKTIYCVDCLSASLSRQLRLELLLAALLHKTYTQTGTEEGHSLAKDVSPVILPHMAFSSQVDKSCPTNQVGIESKHAETSTHL